MELSRRARSLPSSTTLAVLGRAKELRAQGVDVLAFAAGEPDFVTPEPIRAAAIRALEAGMTFYAPVPGDPDARAAITDKLTIENQIPGVTADHIVITTGGKHALYLAFQALLDPALHDRPAPEVIVPTPAWVSYAPQIRLAGGRVVELPAAADQGFKVTPEQIAGAINPQTRVFLFNSPSNPCGVTYSPDEVAAIARALAEAARAVAPDLVVVTDEIYEKLVFDGARHVSLGSFPEIAERTVTINGLSKAYAMTGWRVGYLAGSGEYGLSVAAAVARLQSQTTTSIPAFIYPAIRVALTQCSGEIENMRAAFETRGAVMYERLVTMPGFVCPKPTGAFYLFPDIAALFGKVSSGGRRIESPLDFAEALLLEHHVAAVPGEDFLGPGRRCVRFSFACSEDHIHQGMDRVEAFLAGLR